jgi:predicted acetyltransferase
MSKSPSNPGAIVYRPAAGERDEAAFARILERSFAIPHEAGRVAWKRLGADVRVLSEADEPVACLGWYAFGQWFGGRSIPCAGIAAVGVEPHHRGSGLASRIVAESLRELAAANVPLAALYPSNIELYRRADFEIGGGRYELRTGCATLRRTEALERVVELPAGVNDPRVRRLYERVAATRNGWIDRNDAIWDRVRDFRGEIREGFGVERRVGNETELAAYVFVARRKRRQLGFDLVCGDLAAADGPAGRAILGFLGGHGTIAVDVQVYAAPWDPIVALLAEEPKHHALHFPWMLRVLDLDAALRARGFPRDVRGELHIDVEDGLIARNAGKRIVVVEDGVARVERGGSGHVRMHARALGPWFSGFATAEALAFAGHLGGPREDVATASALMSGIAPTTSDFF